MITRTSEIVIVAILFLVTTVGPATGQTALTTTTTAYQYNADGTLTAMTT